MLVFTNGCFDIVHRGHLDLLERARALGDRLVVGLNSDRSVRAIKGPTRPLNTQDDRARVLRALRCVDDVVVFDETTPERLIEEIVPDVLVKGGDWPTDQIVGAEFVLGRGGQVLALPLTPGYSTTALIDGIQGGAGGQPQRSPGSLDAEGDLAVRSLDEHLETIAALRGAGLDTVKASADIIAAALGSGHRLLLCGNGGSATDAQHIAAEFVGRFEADRRAYPAIALTTNTSSLTAVGNDYGFEQVFIREVEAFATPGDVLVAISTSGTSKNVLLAVMAARRLGCRTIGLTGAKGGPLASLCDVAVLVPSTRTARVQEAHITIGHLWCELVDHALFRRER